MVERVETVRWRTPDGREFNNREAAIEHEIDRILRRVMIGHIQRDALHEHAEGLISLLQQYRKGGDT